MFIHASGQYDYGIFFGAFNIEWLNTWRFNPMTEYLAWSAFNALLVRDCKLLLRKRLADSGGEAWHQQALKRLQRFARSRLQAFAAQKTCGLRWGSFTPTSLEAPSALLVFFHPMHFCASTSAGIKKPWCCASRLSCCSERETWTLGLRVMNPTL